jgi:ferrous iron transport protein A
MKIVIGTIRNKPTMVGLEMRQTRWRMHKGRMSPSAAGCWPGGDGGQAVVATGVKERDFSERRAEAGVDLLWLSELKAGEEATLQGFQAGHGLVSRLSALGFTPGARVTMVQNIGHGPLIVKVRDTRIALGRGEAMKVRVRR